MPQKRLPVDQRRQMILEALDPDSNITEIARRYGVQRVSIYEHFTRILEDPKQRMHEAEAEANFRRKVWELVR